MENTLVEKIKLRLERENISDPKRQMNIVKEELHHYVLSFIYNHPEYSQWTMYGGSVLRICHGLNRMSVDLDFEVEKMPDFKKLGVQLTEYFKRDYNIELSPLDVKIRKKRGITLKFNIASELNIIGSPFPKIHVEIDLHEFRAKNVAFERIPPREKKGFSFLVKTYNLSGLMASKIAAVFGRKQRKRGDILVIYKGRDIYDLLWYMEKKIIPDLDYLREKELDFSDIKELFDNLTTKIGKLDESELKIDLPSLFIDQNFIANWLKNWRDSFFRLKDSYGMYKAKKLVKIRVWDAFGPLEMGSFIFDYIYKISNDKTFTIRYRLSAFWLTLSGGEIDIPVDKKFIALASERPNLRGAKADSMDKYITLFAEKTEDYLKKTNRVVFGKGIITRLIRMTADNLDHQKQIVLDKSALLSCEFEDLMK